MDLRLISASLLLAATTALAQEVPPGSKPPVQEPAAQEPAPQKSSGDIITELQREKARLQREIEYAKSRAKNANKMLAEKLGKRGQSFGSIDAGTNMPARPQPMAMKKARLINESERVNYGDDVMLVVDGLEVRQPEFDGLLTYMQSLSNTGDDAMRSQRIMFELIRVYSVAAAFPENAAEAEITDIYGQLQSGTPMADVVKRHGAVLGAKEDGTVVVTRNSFLGTKFEAMAFGLKEGETSRPFRNVFGYVIIAAEKIEKGSTPELDKVTASAVQVRYSGDQTKLNEAQAAASRGQVEVLVRDEQVLAMLPAMYKPMPATPSKPVDPRSQLTRQLQAVQARIKQLESGQVESANPKTELDALKKQVEALTKAIADLPTPGDDAGGPGVIPAKVIEKGSDVIKKGSVAPLSPKKKL